MLKGPPADLAGNLAYRRRILGLAESSPSAQEEIRLACSRDPVFFVNTFLWTYDSQHHADQPQRPMIMWPKQEWSFRRVLDAVGRHSLLFPKSRRVGVTTTVLAALFWRWRFREMQSFLLCSAKEDRVDRKGDMSCLFAKLDYMHSCLPLWLQVPEVDRALLRMGNPLNGSVFNGESTNADVDRGGVRTAVLADEVAAMANGGQVMNSILPLTESVFAVSTPKGAWGPFFDLYCKWKQKRPHQVLEIHWTMHPRFSEGLYFTSEPVQGYCDPSWHGRKPRSPWYDRECDQMLGPRQIAQELDIAFNEAGGQFFEPHLIDRLLKETVRPPNFRGRLELPPEGAGAAGSASLPRFVHEPHGRLLLWCPLPEGRPPPGQYGLGADPALGTGGERSSQSAISVVDLRTGEKVAQYTHPRILVHEFAAVVVGLARWFYHARVNFGRQGPGATLRQVMTERLGYWNIYRPLLENRQPSGKLGETEMGAARQSLFDNYLEALHRGRFINRSEDALEECRQFVVAPDGSVQHSRAIQRETDPDARGRLHGDIVIADCMACRLLPAQDEPPPCSDPTNLYSLLSLPRGMVAPVGSPAWKLQRYLREKERREAGETY